MSGEMKRLVATVVKRMVETSCGDKLDPVSKST